MNRGIMSKLKSYQELSHERLLDDCEMVLGALVDQIEIELLSEENVAKNPILEKNKSSPVQQVAENTRSKSSITITPILRPIDKNIYQERLFLLSKENLSRKEYQRAKHRLRRELDPRYNGIFIFK